MARPEASGVTVWSDKRAGRHRWPSGRVRYRAKLTWPDGKRQDVAIEESHCVSESTAHARAEVIQASLTKDGPALLAAMTRPKRASGAPPDSTWTIGEYKEHFFRERRASGRVEDVESEEGRMKHLAALEGVAIGALTTPAYRTAMIRVRDTAKAPDGSPLAPRTIIHVHRTFALMFRTAVAEGVVAVNPCVLLPGDLPAKKDKDPKWRKTARFTASELVALTSDERIPEDRRAFWAVMFLGCTRFGEAAARTVADYDRTKRPLGQLTIATSYSTKTKAEKGTKTEVPREMPVHPRLAVILDAWLASGWRRMMGRDPKPDDLLVPSREGRHRNVNHMLRRFKQDCERIGLRTRRQHDTRRTFISLAREGGASDLLKWCTHGAPGEIIDQYTTPSWAKLCAEVLCVNLDVEPKNDEGAEAVTASTPVVPPALSALASAASISSTITSGADGTRSPENQRDISFPSAKRTVDFSPEAPNVDEASRNVANAGRADTAADIRRAALEAAIERLTRALASVDDDAIPELVAERAAMRAELRALAVEDSNVVPIDRRKRRE